MLKVRSGAIRFSGHGLVQRRLRSVRWGALLSYLLVIGGSSVLPLLGWLALIVAGTALGAWLVEVSIEPPFLTDKKSEPGRFELEDGRLRIVTKTRDESIDLATITAGWTEEPDHVVLSLSNGRNILAHVPDAGVRSELLSALGVGAADRVLRVPIYSRAGGVAGGELMLALAGIITWPATIGAWTALSVIAWSVFAKTPASLIALLVTAAFVAGATALSWLLVVALRRRQVVIGTDGIVIEGAWRRVIPFSEIADVSLDDNGVSLSLKNEKIVRLPTGRTDTAYPTVQTEEQSARARRVEERIKEALALSGGSRSLDAKAPWLECPDDDVKAWRTRLETLGERLGDYRRPGISDEELREIACDAGRGADQRAGALFVIGKRGSDHHAVEVVIQASADPELATVLRSALAGDLGKRAVELARRNVRYRILDAELEESETEAEAEAEVRR